MIRTPITYYGGKQLMAKQIVSLMPEHRIYCEPYFGGGAVFFAKKKSYIDAINDLDDKLITFYSVLKNDFISLQRIISETLCSETTHKVAKEIYKKKVPASDVEMAWAVWMITNGSFGGSIYGGWSWCNGTSGSHKGVSLRNKRESLTREVYDRIKDAQISCRDGIHVIHDRDTTDTLFYIDTPYPGAVQNYGQTFAMDQFHELLFSLQSIKGKFILSNYWSQTLRYYCIKNNWTVLRFTSNMKIANLGRQNRRKQTFKEKTEILVMNFIPETISQLKLDI